MFAMDLVDILDNNIYYGILICENDEISKKLIQNKIYEIKENYDNKKIDWIIQDVIKKIPAEWKVKLQECNNRVVI